MIDVYLKQSQFLEDKLFLNPAHYPFIFTPFFTATFPVQ